MAHEALPSHLSDADERQAFLQIVLLPSAGAVSRTATLDHRNIESQRSFISKSKLATRAGLLLGNPRTPAMTHPEA